MTNIYNSMVELKDTCSYDWSVAPLVSSKMSTLLKQSCGIELIGDDQHFTKNISVCGLEVGVDFHFQYGSATLMLIDDKLEVRFYFSDKYKNELLIPFNSKRCQVFVDNELNFQKATLSYSSLHGSLKFDRIIENSLKSYNTITYKDEKTNQDISFQGQDLDNKFFVPNLHFEVTLIKFLECYTHNINQFNSLFAERLNYDTDCFENITNAVNCLNQFNHEYTHNFDELQANLLLIDMQAI